MLLLSNGLDITEKFLLGRGWWTDTTSVKCTMDFTMQPSSSKYWSLERISYFTLQCLWAAICCREFLKQLWALKTDKSNPLDRSPNPHNALGNLYLADAYLADLPEPLPLIAFTVWRICAISAQNLTLASKNTPWFLRQMLLRPNLSAPYCTLMGTYIFS